jgi:hypothetical protein
MPSAPRFLIKRIVESVPRTEISGIPGYTRGIYVLLKKIDESKYAVVYIGRATGRQVCFHARISDHHRKKKDWSHFSLFEVHDNITKEMIGEIEALILHIYSRDSRANMHNLQRRSSIFDKITASNLANWQEESK